MTGKEYRKDMTMIFRCFTKRKNNNDNIEEGKKADNFRKCFRVAKTQCFCYSMAEVWRWSLQRTTMVSWCFCLLRKIDRLDEQTRWHEVKISFTVSNGEMATREYVGFVILVGMHYGQRNCDQILHSIRKGCPRHSKMKSLVCYLSK